MTARSDLDPVLLAWFEDGPSTMPDRVIGVVAERITRQRQRRAWRLLPRRFSTMSSQMRIALLAAIIVAALAGGLFVAGELLAPQPSPSPDQVRPSTPALASPAAVTCDNGTSGCGGLLSAGTHATTQFTVPFEFVAPAGWSNLFDVPRTYGLRIDGAADGSTTPVEVMTMIAVADQRSTRCGPVAKAGVGSSVDELIAYVQGHPGLVAEDPVAVTLDGHTGRQIDFTVSPAWSQMCDNLDRLYPAVLMLTDTGTPPARTVAYQSDRRVRWSIFDIGGDTVLVEYLGSIKDAEFEAHAAAAKAIVDTIHFVPGS